MTLTETAEELEQLVSAASEQLTYLVELGIDLVDSAGQARLAEVEQITLPSRNTRFTTSNQEQLNRPSRILSEAKPQPTSLLNSLFGDTQPAPAPLAPSQESFEDIWSEVGNCTRCPLSEGRTNIVHTEGNRKARLMFVGEAPGADEDLQARPFVGRAGQLLTKIIEAIGFKREEVLIGNINRCRPPGNRPPTTEEASICKPFLLREIATAQPEVIVVLGNTAIRNLLETKEGVSKLRGRFHNYKGIRVMPTFHPAYLLRDPSKKRDTWEDLKKVRAYLDETPVDS